MPDKDLFVSINQPILSALGGWNRYELFTLKSWNLIAHKLPELTIFAS